MSVLLIAIQIISNICVFVCVLPIGQSRHREVDLGCYLDQCRSLPTNRTCAVGSSGSQCPQMKDSPKPERDRYI